MINQAEQAKDEIRNLTIRLKNNLVYQEHQANRSNIKYKQTIVKLLIKKRQLLENNFLITEEEYPQNLEGIPHNLSEVTSETIKNASPFYKQKILNYRIEWLKRQRNQDKLEHRRVLSKINRIKLKKRQKNE